MENTERLKIEIENFVKEKGWRGFFGLLATISPDMIDKDDLEKYSAIPKPSEPVKIPNLDIVDTPIIKTNKSVNEASIYASEHIEAVQADLEEQELNVNNSVVMMQPKVEVIEGKNNPLGTSTPVVEAEPQILTPNPWSNAKTVVPGEVRDMLTR